MPKNSLCCVLTTCASSAEAELSRSQGATNGSSCACSITASSGNCLLRADALVDPAAVPALLGAPAAVMRKLSADDRQGRLAALVGRQVIASLYASCEPDGAARVAAVRLLDVEADIPTAALQQH